MLQGGTTSALDPQFLWRLQMQATHLSQQKSAEEQIVGPLRTCKTNHWGGPLTGSMTIEIVQSLVGTFQITVV